MKILIYFSRLCRWFEGKKPVVAPEINLWSFRVEVFAAISAERNKQDQYQQAGRFKFTCAQDGLSDSEKMTVLTEEHGEVAKEVCELFDKGECPERRARLKKELIQNAAVAVAWLEAIKRQELVSRVTAVSKAYKD